MTRSNLCWWLPENSGGVSRKKHTPIDTMTDAAPRLGGSRARSRSRSCGRVPRLEVETRPLRLRRRCSFGVAHYQCVCVETPPVCGAVGMENRRLRAIALPPAGACQASSGCQRTREGPESGPPPPAARGEMQAARGLAEKKLKEQGGCCVCGAATAKTAATPPPPLPPLRQQLWKWRTLLFLNEYRALMLLRVSTG